MRVIGMISGTSYDAIEAVAAEFDFDGAAVVADVLEHVSEPYPESTRAAIEAILPPASTTIEQVCMLDTLIGQNFASVAGELAERAFGGDVELITSHGQTVFHWVEGDHALGTLQLGQPAFIAERTGATVVGDVRARDIAAGGHGAPLASLVDVLLLQSSAAERGAVCGSLNLGGIANVTIVGGEREPIAFDTGPANALVDAVVNWRSDGLDTYDLDGAGAARGTVDEALLELFLDEPYYRLAPPKSTGKELFHLAYVQDRLGDREIATNDLLATLTALSAAVIAADLTQCGVTEVIAAGGGTRNPVLMRELSERLGDTEITTMDSYGVPAVAKEALLMGLIGFLTVHGLPGAIPSCTGAGRPVVLGSIVPGVNGLRLSADAAVPDRLVVRNALGAEPATPR
jgi:anhydro-N-acetylmuramic acid kinase